MVSVLIDQNIVSYGRIMDSVKIDGVIGYVRKKPKLDESLKLEIDCLPTISKLIRESKISAYRYTELDYEDWKSSGSGRGNLGDLFPSLQMNTIEPAIERSYFFQSKLSKYTEKESVKDFCQWLNAKGARDSIYKIVNISTFPEKMRENIDNISRYQEICRRLQKIDQYIDAFHLWSGEIRNISYFLTVDKKFINAVNKANSSCIPILPSEFIKIMNVDSNQPFEFAEDVFYGLGGQYLWEIA
jgi:hypothetical protein